MDRSGIRKAAKLLAKAESTDSDAEAMALAMRSYRLIAEALNTYDRASTEPLGETRRRERRLIRDRRTSRQPPTKSSEDPGTGPDTSKASEYLRLGEGTARERRLDLPM